MKHIACALYTCTASVTFSHIFKHKSGDVLSVPESTEFVFVYFTSRHYECS
jgi:hypothetical protein